MSRTAQRHIPAEVPAPVSRFRVGQRVRLNGDGLQRCVDPERARFCVGTVKAVRHVRLIEVEWDVFSGLYLPITYHEDWLEAAE